MKWVDSMKNKVKSFLTFRKPVERDITIKETTSFKGNAIKNKIWYRGDANELDQLYKQLKEPVNSARFWAASATTIDIRKVHSGVPSIIVNKLAEIVGQDFNGMKLEIDSQEKLWAEIEKENEFDSLLSLAITEALISGDGVFKISTAPDVSSYPIIEFVPGERVDFTLNRGRIREVIFTTEYANEEMIYTLVETYGYGYVRYKLYKDDKDIPLTSIPQTEKLADISFDASLLLAIPFKIYSSLKYPNRGKSIYDSKTDIFDALDEIISQWMDAVRDGRVSKYIPESLIPRNQETGEIIKPNSFDSRYIATPDNLNETAKNEVAVTQPDIKYDAFLTTYLNVLDMCMQGLVSPCTLGIDVKKMDNAESQREKEKTTMYARNEIIKALNKAIPKLVEIALKTYWAMNQMPVEDIKASITFGEYAAPDFGTVVEIVAKAKMGGIMSVERAVEELYGNTLTDDEKTEEVLRIKSESGLTEAMPSGSQDDMPSDSLDADISTALNGAQVTSLLKIVQSVKSGELSRNAAISLVTSTLGVSRENAEQILERQAV